MTLSAFLEAFFTALASQGVRFCVLRNYDGLPEVNVGSDIDVLVERTDLARALKLLAAVRGLEFTDVARRPYVTSVFITGVERTCIQLDLWTTLSWRGVNFIDAAQVLDRVHAHPRCEWIPIPDPVDEGVISFATSFVIGGFIKGRYSEAFVPVFRDHGALVEERLQDAIEPGLIRRLIQDVRTGQYESALKSVGPVRASLFRRAVYRNPWVVASATMRHFASEVSVHLSSSNLCTVAVFGPDGAGKSAVVDSVAVRLSGCTKVIETRHLRPQLRVRPMGKELVGPVVDPHARPAKSVFASMLQLCVWIAAYWLDRLFRRKRNSTLRVYDRYFHDVLVDPRRYRYGGALWFARLVSRLVPQPDLVVILDAPPEVLRSRKQEVAEEETIRQRLAYLQMAHFFPNTMVVDASLPLDEVVDRVQQGVIEFMVRRTMGVSRELSRP